MTTHGPAERLLKDLEIIPETSDSEILYTLSESVSDSEINLRQDSSTGVLFLDHVYSSAYDCTGEVNGCAVHMQRKLDNFVNWVDRRFLNGIILIVGPNLNYDKFLTDNNRVEHVLPTDVDIVDYSRYDQAFVIDSVGRNPDPMHMLKSILYKLKIGGRVAAVEFSSKDFLEEELITADRYIIHTNKSLEKILRICKYDQVLSYNMEHAKCLVSEGISL